MDSLSLPQILSAKLPMINDRKLLDKIAAAGQLMSLKQGTTILDYGQYIKLVPIVLDGVIKVTQQGEEGDILLYYLSNGSTCPTAFTCCMIDKTSEIRAVAEEDTQILAIPIRYIDEWSRDHVEWKNFIMDSYSVRFKELLSTIDAIAFAQLDQRLIKYLSKKMELTHKKEFNITHKQIALDLNTTREAVSRLLKKMEQMGNLELGRNRITIKHLEIR
ncbi:Crp/Fnr family transcriptional regulator [Aureispira anguillae]|uniref:Crp/Fnr family transcriptional regulator n=1 Tax=Aureispira anguillae TaxID=2864201 RepID=A0A916DXZ8_9BACT|nr:Crp/Fnr family transcriptional regulator [Aureispira anguillae]BDS15551.1 Crp/Fnr family transcriptional regulator [Aureispira anguillae]